MRVAHGQGPLPIALNHVVQVSTLCRRACMNVAGCILANEQLVSLRIHAAPWERSGEILQVIEFMEIKIFLIYVRKKKLFLGRKIFL